MKSSKYKKRMLAPRKVRASILTFFENLLDRRFSDAERALDKIREKEFTEEGFKQGYIHALEGILLSNRSGDERDFYNKTDLTFEEMEKYSHEFRDFISESTHSFFDGGYFSAWSDLMKYRSTVKK